MQTARKSPSLRAAAQRGVCFAVLLGIVGSTTTGVARLASIRVGPKQCNREYLCRGSLAHGGATASSRRPSENRVDTFPKSLRRTNKQRRQGTT